MKRLPIIESYWVEENKFLAGEYPGSVNPEDMRRRMDAFLECGVTTFINLTQAHELLPYENILAEQGGMYGINTSHQRFAIRDHSVPKAETMTAILDAIDEEINGGRCVYVHCWGGVGRTGMVVGCYLVRHGASNEAAAAEVNRLFKTRPVNPYFSRSPESDEQVNFILNWWEDPDALRSKNRKFCEG